MVVAFKSDLMIQLARRDVSIIDAQDDAMRTGEVAVGYQRMADEPGVARPDRVCMTCCFALSEDEPVALAFDEFALRRILAGRDQQDVTLSDEPNVVDCHDLSSPRENRPPIPANVACQRCPIRATSLNHLALVQVGGRFSRHS